MTLTEVSYNLRKYMPYVILAGIGVLIIFYIFKITLLLIEANRKPPVFTNTIFGIIKKPYIKDASSSARIKFTLDTVEGVPVTATEAAKVFFLPAPTTKFGYRENSFLMANNIGVNTQQAKYRLIGKQAKFDADNQKLTIDIGTFNFNYQLLFEKDLSIFDNITTPTSNDSQTAAISFLQSINRYPDEFTTGDVHVIFFHYDPKKKTLGQVQRSIEANTAEVDFFREKIGDYPIVSPSYFNSQNFVFGLFDSDSNFKILRAQVAYFEKSSSQIGVYPLKKGDNAYEELLGGKGLVVSNPHHKKNVVIKKMFLAYFDPDIYQEYLQPVYVFLGEDDFVAYVPAVSDDFLGD